MWFATSSVGESEEKTHFDKKMKGSRAKVRLFRRTLKARFISRPNRFLVRCALGGETVSAYLPNPGRLQELLLPGRTIYLVREDGSRRKTHFTVVAVLRDRVPIFLHTHKTNQVARYLIELGKVPGLEGAHIVQSEIRVGRNRFDFLLKRGRKEILMEVKSCTLVGKRVAMFPDAVTERGARHLAELAALSGQGRAAVVLFIVHWPFVRFFMPDYHTDLDFSRALLSIRDRVEVIPVSVRWQKDLSLGSSVRRLQIPWEFIEQEAKDCGSYLLILELRRAQRLFVGALGRISFEKGWYIYVGSAMAHLSRRMERHQRLRKRHHWHIDELRAVAEFRSILAIRSSTRLECEIAQAVSKLSQWSIPGFGSSDCSCKTHLFGFEKDPLCQDQFYEVLQHFRMDRFRQLHIRKPHEACGVSPK